MTYNKNKAAEFFFKFFLYVILEERAIATEIYCVTTKFHSSMKDAWEKAWFQKHE